VLEGEKPHLKAFGAPPPKTPNKTGKILKLAAITL
jgi:hypothetical protein